MAKRNARAYLANNCRALTDNELSFMNAKYRFWLDNEDVCVACQNRARVTRHAKAEKFSINIKQVRKITFSVFAINMFEEFQQSEKLKKYTLVDIQNALNICRLMYQPLTKDSVLRILEK